MTNLLVKNILKTLEKNGFEAYLVGGAVRDYLLNCKTNDFDIATNALPSDLVKIFGSPLKQIEYGSYNLQQKGLNIDITTYRQEHNYNNRHPKIYLLMPKEEILPLMLFILVKIIVKLILIMVLKI